MDRRCLGYQTYIYVSNVLTHIVYSPVGSGKVVLIVAFVTATVGRNVVPLDQDQVALEAGWEAVLVGGVVVLGGGCRRGWGSWGCASSAATRPGSAISEMYSMG